MSFEQREGTPHIYWVLCYKELVVVVVVVGKILLSATVTCGITDSAILEEVSSLILALFGYCM